MLYISNIVFGVIEVKAEPEWDMMDILLEYALLAVGYFMSGKKSYVFA